MNLLEARAFFDSQTPVGRFILLIGSDPVGEFFSPLPLVGNIQYFCRFCGEVFAKRLVDRDALWDFMSGSCLTCEKSVRHGAWQSFLLPGEESFGFRPREILAAEFLFNTKHLELKNERSSISLDWRAEDPVVFASATIPDRPEGDPLR